MIEIDRSNFAQFVCRRPGMYTNNSTLGELLAVLVGFEAGNCNARTEHRDKSAKDVMRWLLSEFGEGGSGSDNGLHIVANLLRKYDTDENAIAAIRVFASSLPPCYEPK